MPSAMSLGRDNRIARRYGSQAAIGGDPEEIDWAAPEVRKEIHPAATAARWVRSREALGPNFEIARLEILTFP